MRSGKVWGMTEQIEANSSFELHRLEINAGFECSKHKHVHKFNGFYVERGTLEIHVWKNSYDLVDVTVLHAGDYTKVNPGEFHKFVCTEDAICFEFYWVEFNHDDIVRENVGGATQSNMC